MSIFKTDYLQFGENLYEVVPPVPTEDDRGGIIASPKTDAETIEAKLGDDGKLYVGADAKGSAAAALSLANENTQTKIDELSEAVDGKLAGKADTNHDHTTADIEYNAPAQVLSADTLEDALMLADEYIAKLQTEKVGYSELNAHKNDSKIHVTQADKDKWNAAEQNQNAFTTIINSNGQEYGAASSEGSFSIIGADGITVSIGAGKNADQDITIYNDGILEIETGSTNGTIKVDGTDVAVKGLGTAAYESMDNIQASIDAKADASALAGKAPATHNHDDKYYTEAEIDTKVDELNSKIINKANTVHKHNSSDVTYDGITGNYVESNANLSNVVEVLDETLNSKANLSALNSHKNDTTIHVTSTNKTQWNEAYSHVSKTDNPHGVTKAQVGLGNVDNTSDANKPVSTAQQTAMDSLLAEAKKYADDKDALLLNNSSAAVDSIMELATAMEENEEVVDALELAIGNKADKTHNHDDRYYTESEIDTKLGAKADASTLSNKADKTHSHDDKYYTETEIDAMKETMVFIDEDDNEDVADPGSTTTIAVDSALSSTSTNPVQNKVVKAALDNKCDKSYIADIFMQLKTALENSNIDGAIAVLDSAILDMTTLA